VNTADLKLGPFQLLEPLASGGKILGVICRTDSLHNSDSIVGNPGSSYPGTQNARGYENGAEIVTLTDSSFTVNQWHSTFPGEQTRIITVPGAAATTSYGFNNQARSNAVLAGHQVLLAGYKKPVIDLDGKLANDDNTSANYDTSDWIVERHAGGFNVLYGDGSVRMQREKAFFDPTHSHWPAKNDY